MLTMGEQQGFWARLRTGIEYVSAERTASVSETQSATINAPAGIAENDLLLACLIHEGAGADIPACSGWSYGRIDTYNGLNCTVLYKWATSADESETDYTFTHSDSSYGGFGGAILLFRGSIKRGHYPIYRVSDVLQTTDSGNAEQTWNSYTLNADITGAIVLAFAAARRSPQGEGNVSLDLVNTYTEVYGLGQFIGGYGSGNCVGGCIGYIKFAVPGVAPDAGSNAAGEAGDVPCAWYESARLYMLI